MNVVNSEVKTALWYAVFSENEDAVSVLLEAGARPAMSALALASSRGRRDRGIVQAMHRFAMLRGQFSFRIDTT